LSEDYISASIGGAASSNSYTCLSMTRLANPHPTGEWSTPLTTFNKQNLKKLSKIERMSANNFGSTPYF